MTNFERAELAPDPVDRKAAQTERARSLHILKQSALIADQVTNDPAWDTLLQYIQAIAEAAIEQRERYLEQILSPLLVDPNQIAQMRIAAIRLDERVNVLKVVTRLPKVLKLSGENAKAELDELLKTLAETGTNEQ